jgi:hypothetical protein
METTPLDGPGRRPGPLAAPAGSSDVGADVSDIAGPIREFNAANKTHEELWARVHQTSDVVRHYREEEKLARQGAGEEHDAHLAVQAEHPNRRAPLVRQAVIAAASVGLDAVACWFAAQALGNDQLETVLWAGLFLAILAGGEVALDHYSERSRSAWCLLAAGLAVFVTGLGVLRFLFLDTVGTGGAIAALTGAALFTAATAGFVMIGYRALRAAETFRASRARLRARTAAREARAAAARLASAVAQRDRLVDAYLSRIRVFLLKTCTSSELPLMEEAIRGHLIGRDAR